jgi:GAF domain-containing protein
MSSGIQRDGHALPNSYWAAFRFAAYCGAIVRFWLKWQFSPHAAFAVSVASAGAVIAGLDATLSSRVRTARWQYRASVFAICADVAIISILYACTGIPESDIFLFYYLPVVMAAEYLRPRQILALSVFVGALMGINIVYLVLAGLPSETMPLLQGIVRVLAPREVFLALIVWISVAYKRARVAQKERERNLADVISAIPSASVLDRELDALLDDLISLGYHRAYVALVDDLMDIVYVARARNIAPRQVAMSRFSLKCDDIMCDVVLRARAGNFAPQVFPPNFYDSRFNRAIYDAFEHKDLARAFLPIVTHAHGERFVVGILECGCFGDNAFDVVQHHLKDAELLAQAHAQTLGDNRTHVLLSAIADRAARIINADAASIHMYEDNDLCYQAGAGRVTQDFLARFLPSEYPGIFGREAMESRQPVIASKNDLELRNPKLLKQGVNALIALPLLNLGSDNRKGVLYLHSWKPRRFTSADTAIAMLFAEQLGAVIQNYLSLVSAADAADWACQITVLQNSIQSLASGKDVDITSEIAKHTLSYFPDADCVALYEYSDETHQFDAPPVTAGDFLAPNEMSGAVGEGNAAALWALIEQRQPLFLSDVLAVAALKDAHPTSRHGRFVNREKITSSAQLPLRDQTDTLVGLLFVNYRRPHWFDEGEKKAMGSFALAAAIAIQNRRQKEHIAELQTKIRELNASLLVEDVADHMLTDVMVLAPYTSAAVQSIRGDSRTIIKARGFQKARADEDSLRPVSRDPWLTSVLRSTRPTIINDTKAIPNWGLQAVRSWIGLPLRHRDEPIGLITIDHMDLNAFKRVDAAKLEEYGIAVAATLYKATEFTEARRHIDDLELIRRIQEKAYASPLGGDLPKAIVVEVGRTMDCDLCGMYLKDRHGDRILLRPAAFDGTHSSIVQQRGATDVAAAAKTSALLRAFNGETVLVSGWESSTEKAGNDREERRAKPRSIIASPIREAQHSIGVITVEKDCEGYFGASDAKVLEQVALAAGAAFRRDMGLELLQHVSQLLLKAKSVDEVLPQILSNIVRLMDADDAAIFILNGPTARDVTRSFFSEGMAELEPRTGGLTENIIRQGLDQSVEDTHGHPLIGSEVRSKYASLVGIPLGINGRVKGVLYVFSRTRRAFLETELSVLKSLAGQAALGIQKTKLLEAALGEKNALHRLLALDRLAGELFHDVKGPLASFNRVTMEVEQRLVEAREALELVQSSQSLPQHVVTSAHNALQGWHAVTRGLQTLRSGAELVTARATRIAELMDEIPSDNHLERLTVRALLRRAHQKALLGKELPRVELICDYLSCDAQVETDAPIVVAALSNIIWNAVEALGDQEGTVVLSAYQQGEFAIIRIKDNGCGISSGDLGNIFKFGFSKGKSRISGYGLWFADLVFKATGINCDVESNPGKGTTFALSLPCKQPSEELSCDAVLH